MTYNTPYGQLLDSAWLRDIYVDQQKSMAQVAELVGCSTSAVRSALVWHQIPRRPRRGTAVRAVDEHGDTIARLYRDGLTGKQIAAKLDLGKQTVYLVLIEQGVPRRTSSSRRHPSTDRETIVDLYVNQRLSTLKVGKILRVSPRVIERRLHEYGISPRGVGRDNDPEFSEENLRRLYEVEQRPVKEIAALLGTSTVTLWKYLGRRGIAARSRSEIQRLRLPPPGTILSRTVDKRGYALISAVRPDGSVIRDAEHRYVMSEHLKRPLRSDESVHHINGCRTDNRVNNLQLRQGSHGTGVVFSCLDCGSHNVSAVEIADPD